MLPALVLEAVGSGTTEGTVISIGKPAGTPNQKWVITAKGNNRYSIKPSYSSTLVLAAARGGTEIGTAIVLETESGKPWQEWNLKKNDNGSYCLIPRHAPEKGLDHLGGRAVAGAKIDLWANNPGDQHLEWIVKPLAGTMAAVAPAPENRHPVPTFRPKSNPKTFAQANSRTSRSRPARFFRAPSGK